MQLRRLLADVALVLGLLVVLFLVIFGAAYLVGHVVAALLPVRDIPTACGWSAVVVMGLLVFVAVLLAWDKEPERF